MAVHIRNLKEIGNQNKDLILGDHLPLLRVMVPVLGHVLKHVPRHVLEHMPGHLLEQVPKHMPDRHVFDRHVPEH